jgi:ceramide glucosyltransferase
VILRVVLVVFVIASWVWWIVAWWTTRAFFRDSELQESEGEPVTPPVSILKPVKGLDHGAYESFASFCDQDYPQFELVFAVADADDPAVAVIRRLQREHPHRSIRLIVGQSFGANRKASLLHHLSSEAAHEVLVISDSDMRVTRDYLRRVVAPLADRTVGLVTCPYKGDGCSNVLGRLEALHMGATFLPAVLVARHIVAGLAMGATIALHKYDLERLGGFAAVADYLADDYQIGVRVAELGKRVEISDYVVVSIIGSPEFVAQWRREVRWAKCNRVCRPNQYPWMFLMFSTPLSLLYLASSGFDSLGWGMLAISVTMRWIVAWSVASYTGDTATQASLAWLPARDVLSAAVWCAGLIGRRVVWRGEEFVLSKDGRMAPASSAREGQLPRIQVTWDSLVRRWRDR